MYLQKLISVQGKPNSLAAAFAAASETQNSTNFDLFDVPSKSIIIWSITFVQLT
jgi:hypothetical protein